MNPYPIPLDGWLCMKCGASGSETGPCASCGGRMIRENALARTGIQEAESESRRIPPEVEEALRDPVNHFGAFALLEEIGSGGAGVVHRAWDRDTNRFVALKILKKEKADHVARFLREAHATTRLSHPHVVKIHRTGEFDGRHFIVMELIPGLDLAEHLVKKGTPKIRDRMKLFLSLCTAIRHAHEKGIIHRDIKPANILVDDEGRPYVVDFGLSRFTEPGWTITMPNQPLGTPMYMSPEQVRGGSESLRPTTDIYSLGAVLYFILTGQPPLQGRTAFEVMERVTHDHPPSPRRLDSQIHEDLETICMKCLEKDPARRYPGVDRLEEDIQRWLDGRPILARRVTMMYRLRRFIGRKRAVLLPLIALILVTTGVGIFEWQRAGDISNRIRLGLAEAARLEETGRNAEARDEYQKVLQLAPDSPSARNGFRRTDAAAREAKRKLERESRSAANRSRANQLLDRARPKLDSAARSMYERNADMKALFEKVQRAQQWINEAIDLAADVPHAHELQARAWELQSRDDLAEPSLRRALALDPELGGARYQLGRLLVRKSFQASLYAPGDRFRQRKEAARIAEEANKELAMSALTLREPRQRELADAMIAFLRDDFESLHRITSSVIERYGNSPGIEEFHWLRGMSAPKGRFDSFTRALDIRPNFPFALWCRATLLLQDLRFKDALADLDRAVAIQPRFINAILYRGAVKLAMGDAEAAVADMTLAIDLFPTIPRGYTNRATIHALRNRLQPAIQDFSEAIRLDPTSPWPYAGRSAVYRRTGNHRSAIADANRALELDPTCRAAWNHLGSAYRGLANHAEAIRCYEKAIEIDPEDPIGYVGRGKTLFLMKDYPKSLASLEQGIARNPEAWDALYYRARILQKAGETRRAIAELDKVLELKPDFDSARYHRGRARISNNDGDGALADFNELIRRNERSPEGFFGRALLHSRRGDREKAVADCRKALEVAPGDWPGRTQAGQMLRLLTEP